MTKISSECPGVVKKKKMIKCFDYTTYLEGGTFIGFCNNTEEIIYIFSSILFLFKRRNKYFSQKRTQEGWRKILSIFLDRLFLYRVNQ